MHGFVHWWGWSLGLPCGDRADTDSLTSPVGSQIARGTGQAGDLIALILYAHDRDDKSTVQQEECALQRFSQILFEDFYKF